jgi:hypothetical protein
LAKVCPVGQRLSAFLAKVCPIGQKACNLFREVNTHLFKHPAPERV